jgi:hypothetical protein
MKNWNVLMIKEHTLLGTWMQKIEINLFLISELLLGMEIIHIFFSFLIILFQNLAKSAMLPIPIEIFVLQLFERTL